MIDEEDRGLYAELWLIFRIFCVVAAFVTLAALANEFLLYPST